jgi:hypothetical protein
MDFWSCFLGEINVTHNTVSAVDVGGLLIHRTNQKRLISALGLANVWFWEKNLNVFLGSTQEV